MALANLCYLDRKDDVARTRGAEEQEPHGHLLDHGRPNIHHGETHLRLLYGIPSASAYAWWAGGSAALNDVAASVVVCADEDVVLNVRADVGGPSSWRELR